MKVSRTDKLVGDGPIKFNGKEGSKTVGETKEKKKKQIVEDTVKTGENQRIRSLISEMTKIEREYTRVQTLLNGLSQVSSLISKFKNSSNPNWQEFNSRVSEVVKRITFEGKEVLEQFKNVSVSNRRQLEEFEERVNSERSRSEKIAQQKANAIRQYQIEIENVYASNLPENFNVEMLRQELASQQVPMQFVDRDVVRKLLG